MARTDNSAVLYQEEIDQDLDTVIREFQMQLFKKTPEDFRRKGSCKHLKDTAIRIARLLVESTGQHEPPIKLNPICRKRLIHTIIPDRSLSSYTAELIPDANGFTIRISDRPGRRRTAIAHEIGHSLFYDTRKLPPVRIFAGTSRWAQKDKEEWISWDFARELLLPQKPVADELRRDSGLPSAKRITEFARKWRVSVEILCHRAIRDLGFWRSCAVFTCDLVENRIEPATIRIYRGRKFPRIYFTGRAGLLTSSSKFTELMSRFQKLEEPSVEPFEEPLDYSDFKMRVQLFRYPELSSRVVGVLQTPTVAAQAGDPE